MATKDVFFTVRLDRARARKLDQLAGSTERSKGAVLRLLLDQAIARETPDVILAGEVRGGNQ